MNDGFFKESSGTVPSFAPAPKNAETQRWTLRDYLSSDTIIPGLIIAAVVAFILFEFIIPYLRDATAFYGAPVAFIDHDPIKTPSSTAPFVFKGTHGLYTHKYVYILTPVSNYEIEARVLHTRHYYSDANSADLVPFDMGLGWKIMSDAKALSQYIIFHHENVGGRILWAEPKIDWREIPAIYLEEISAGLSFSNNHLIPANDEIYDKLAKMSAGDIVRLKGLLVDISRPDNANYRWVTSKHPREDRNKNNHLGDGQTYDNLTTCDTMFVTSAEIVAE